MFDLLQTSHRTSEQLSIRLASLLPLPRSDIYGGELTQYLDRGAGLQKFVDERGLRLERVTLPPGVVATTRLSSPTALGTTSGSSSMGTFTLTILLVAIAAAAIARYGIPRTVRVWLRNTGLWGWGSTNGAKRHMHVPTEDAVEEEQEALTASPSAPIVPKLSTRAIGSYIDTPALAPDPHDPEGSPRYDGSRAGPDRSKCRMPKMMVVVWRMTRPFNMRGS